MYNLATFGFNDMMELRRQLRSLLEDEPATIEEAGHRVVRLFREQIVDANGQPACALVRLYKTHRYAALDPELQAFARRIDPEAERTRDLRCLVLVATMGDEPAWSSRHLSRGHRAIPLTTEEAVQGAPMIARLIQQLGVPLSAVLKPAPALLLDLADKTHNVFYIPRAEGSPYLPAQDEFVKPYGIASVVGFGGMIASGDLFAAILFSRVPITPEVADLFKVIGLNLKLAMLGVARKPLFAASAG